jgi:hypothetical protein
MHIEAKRTAIELRHAIIDKIDQLPSETRLTLLARADEVIK